MTPCTAPCGTVRSTLETAVKPPNRLVRFLTSSSIVLCSLGFADRLEAAPHQEIVDDSADPARHEDDDQHDHHAEDQHARRVVLAREVVDDRHHDRADHAAPDVADTAG